MDSPKAIRWRQRFENFERSYQLLASNIDLPIVKDVERAGIIQFFEIAFELSWKVMKDYLEVEGFDVKSPREAIKQAYQIDLIDDGHIWIDALVDRNRTVHMYDEALAKQMVEDIREKYFPEIEKLYHTLKEKV